MQIMRLEDFRGMHAGDVAAWLDGGDIVPASFHHHANQAHWHTVNCLLRLSGTRVDGVVSDAIGIVEWWRTIESLTALLYETAVREGEQRLRPRPTLPRRNVDAIQRWSAVTHWFSDGRDAPAKAVTGRMTELRDFRNSFEHTSRSASRDRRHSRLSPAPAHANEVDLMEAMAICISACEVVRGVLPGVDLMPQVVVQTGDSFFFERIDILATDILVPIFERSLAAVGLTSDFAMYEKPNRLQGTALLPVSMVIRYEDERPLPPLPAVVDSLQRLQAYGASHPGAPGPGDFALPSYVVPPHDRATEAPRLWPRPEII